jgi:hypothetical protein
MPEPFASILCGAAAVAFMGAVWFIVHEVGR